jgi:hypothetical protein
VQPEARIAVQIEREQHVPSHGHEFRYGGKFDRARACWPPQSSCADDVIE